MGLRIFSINKDGSYFEVPSKKESLLRGDGAYLIVDRREKKIFIYRKLGISSSLSYSAGRAATNLNTQKGSKYQIIYIEEEEKDRFLPSIYERLEASVPQEIEESKPYDSSIQSYVYGEKTIPTFKAVEYAEQSRTPTYTKQVVSTEIKKPQPKEVTQTYQTQRIDDIVKTLASQILFETNIDETKRMKKPPRNILKSELIKKIDTLLDIIYEGDT